MIFFNFFKYLRKMKVVFYINLFKHNYLILLKIYIKYKNNYFIDFILIKFLNIFYVFKSNLIYNIYLRALNHNGIIISNSTYLKFIIS